MLGNFLVVERLAASQEGFSSMELIGWLVSNEGERSCRMQLGHYKKQVC
jgi:hypothetical protein